MIARLLARATAPPVLTWFAVLNLVVLVGLGARHLVAIDSVVDEQCQARMGDFLAFFTGAELVATGAGAQLYDLDAQHERQQALADCPLPAWQPYANPPLLAAALAPLAPLGPLWAFRIYGVLVLASLGFALRALVRTLPQLGQDGGSGSTAAMLVVGFLPVVHTALGGQNTALTLALWCAAIASFSRGHDAWGGVCLALTSYKPQLLPVLLLALLLERRWRALAAAGVMLVAHYLIGAWLAGFGWPLRYLAFLEGYRALEWDANIGSHISLVAFFTHALGGTVGKALGWLAAAAVVLLCSRALWRATCPLALRWGLVLVTAMLASPHLQYYDVGLLALPVLLGVEHVIATTGLVTPRARLAIAAAFLGYPLALQIATLGLQPLVLWPMLAFAWLWRRARAC